MTTTEATELTKAQAPIVAMLCECGLSQVNICVDPEYNRYTVAANNGGGRGVLSLCVAG